MIYADYDYYKNTYKGNLSNDLFSSYIVKASKEIDRNINIVLTEELFESYTDKEQDDIRHTACLLTDYSNANKITAYSSLSIDGVSKTVKDNIILKQEKNDILGNLPQSLTRYL